MKTFAVSVLAGLAAQAEAFWGTAHLLGKSTLLKSVNKDFVVDYSCQTSLVTARAEQPRRPYSCPQRDGASPEVLFKLDDQ